MSLADGKYQFELARYIMKNEFTGGIDFGKQRIGKTVYAMKVAHDIYGNWDDVFKNMFYKMDDIIDYLEKNVDTGVKTPVTIWDDAGVHANKMLFFNSRDMAEMLQRLFDVVGIATRAIILTTPVPSNLLKSLRDYEFLRIKISRKNQFWRRMARIYSTNLLPSGKALVHTEFDDEYDARLPDDIYARYVPIRTEYFKEGIRNLRDLIQTMKVKKNPKEFDDSQVDEWEDYVDGTMKQKHPQKFKSYQA